MIPDKKKTSIRANNTEEKNKASDNKATEEDKSNKDKLSNDTVIRILALLVFTVLLFFLGVRYYEYRNRELISDFYENTAVFNTSEYTTAKLCVNINTAGIPELSQLPGIGNTKAQAIIDYREQNGYFIEIDDLKNVKGIGEEVFNMLKDFITADVIQETSDTADQTETNYQEGIH